MILLIFGKNRLKYFNNLARFNCWHSNGDILQHTLWLGRRSVGGVFIIYVISHNNHCLHHLSHNNALHCNDFHCFDQIECDYLWMLITIDGGSCHTRLAEGMGSHLYHPTSHHHHNHRHCHHNHLRHNRHHHHLYHHEWKPNDDEKTSSSSSNKCGSFWSNQTIQ